MLPVYLQSMKIGVFDSGKGGYTIYDPLKKQLPQHQYIYLADSKNSPYSEKTIEELHQICQENAQSLINKGCQVVVVACNTATVTSLEYLRQQFPQTKFVGTVPAVKPAAEQTSSGGHVLVMATKNTVNSQYLHNLIKPFQDQTRFSFLGSTKLVELIETNDQEGIKQLLTKVLHPYLKDKVEAVVFGCTHFPLVQEQIQEVLGYTVKFFSSTQGVIDQVKRVTQSD